MKNVVLYFSTFPATVNFRFLNKTLWEHYDEQCIWLSSLPEIPLFVYYSMWTINEHTVPVRCIISYHQSFQIIFVTKSASCILSLNLFFIFICILIFIYKEFAVKISYQAKALKYFRNLPLVEIMEKLCFLPSSFH